MDKATQHDNDPWLDGVRPIQINPESRVARTLTIIGKVLAVLFKIAFCLFLFVAKIWAAMDDGKKEKSPMEKAEEELDEARYRDYINHYYYYDRD